MDKLWDIVMMLESMQQTETHYRQLTLAQRPQEHTLRLRRGSVPTSNDGQMRFPTEFLSPAPYMRGRVSDAPADAPPMDLGNVMVGGTVACVHSSKLKDFKPRDWVLYESGWQDYALSDGTDVSKLTKGLAHPSWALEILGMPGFTAWAGYTHCAQQ
jgi:NADPH-dependent curcumin reductase CurA